MKKNFACWLLVSLSTACGANSNSTSSDSPDFATAEQAIMHLEAQDKDAVKTCMASASDCDVNTMQCAELEQECQALEAELKDTRGPIVSCWQQVQDCDKAGKGSCKEKVAECKDQEDKSKEHREQTVGCSEIAHACAKDADRTEGCGERVSSECQAFHDRVKAESNKGKDGGTHDEGNDEHAASSGEPKDDDHPMPSGSGKPEHPGADEPHAGMSDAGMPAGGMGHTDTGEHGNSGMSGQDVNKGKDKTDAGE